MKRGPQTAAADALHAMKYRQEGETFVAAMDRIAHALADSEHHEHELRELLLDQRFVPAGRIQAAIGASKQVTAFNCSASLPISDSFVDGPGSIMDRAKEAATTMRMGCGIGYDFSPLRPRGDIISKLQSHASGPVSFMQIYNAVCLATSSSGHRRGAQMATLRCLSGNTRIHTIEGEFSIRSLVGKTPYLYCSDGERVRVRKATAVFCNGRKQVIRVVLDNDDSIICTTDHRFLLSDGTYQEAGNLTMGTSLLGFYKRMKPRRYDTAKIKWSRTIQQGNQGTPDYNYRMIGEALHPGLLSRADLTVDHINNDSMDDSIENLQILTKREHGIKTATLDGFPPPSRLGAHHTYEAQAKMSAQRIGRTPWNKGQKKKASVVANHKVVRIEDAGETDVYDISVPDFHNFVANGVFVHNCDHPSIEEFIAAKQNTDQLTGFNISACLTDEFMEAVSADRPFDLRFNGRIYKTVSAVELWESLMRSTWDWAEPGVIFIDRVNHMNNLWYAETIHTTNPCSEVPLPPGGVCLLGSINLVKYITRQPDNIYAIDIARLEADIPAIISALDNVIDRSLYPLPEQRAEELSKRRIGLGVMGLANAIEATGPFYASSKFLAAESQILQTILHASYRASIEIAKQKGPFPLFDVDQYPRGNFVKTLPDDIREQITVYGIRNSHLTSIAPTGTISQCCDNISSGIEPVWSYSTERKINTPAGSEVVTLADYGMKNFNTHGRLAHDVTPAEHVQVLTEAQKWVDQSISKTVNCPADMPWAAFKNVYLQAWEGGAKGCATFTDGGLRSGLLKKVVEADGLACRIDPETGMRSCD